MRGSNLGTLSARPARPARVAWRGCSTLGGGYKIGEESGCDEIKKRQKDDDADDDVSGSGRVWEKS